MPYFDVGLKDPEIENYQYFPWPRCLVVFEFFSRTHQARHLENHGMINVWSIGEEKLRELFRNPIKIKKLLKEKNTSENIL